MAEEKKRERREEMTQTEIIIPRIEELLVRDVILGILETYRRKHGIIFLQYHDKDGAVVATNSFDYDSRFLSIESKGDNVQILLFCHVESCKMIRFWDEIRKDEDTRDLETYDRANFVIMVKEEL